MRDKSDHEVSSHNGSISVGKFSGVAPSHLVDESRHGSAVLVVQLCCFLHGIRMLVAKMIDHVS